MYGGRFFLCYLCRVLLKPTSGNLQGRKKQGAVRTIMGNKVQASLLSLFPFSLLSFMLRSTWGKTSRTYPLSILVKESS